jgi:hypothetical protein
MVSIAVLTAAPVDVEPLPVLARALVKALRTALLLVFLEAEAVALAIAALPLAADADKVALGPDLVVVTEPAFAAAAVTVTAGAFVTAVPAGAPPEMAT